MQALSSQKARGALECSLAHTDRCRFPNWKLEGVEGGCALFWVGGCLSLPLSRFLSLSLSSSFGSE